MRQDKGEVRKIAGSGISNCAESHIAVNKGYAATKRQNAVPNLSILTFDLRRIAIMKWILGGLQYYPHKKTSADRPQGTALEGVVKAKKVVTPKLRAVLAPRIKLRPKDESKLAKSSPKPKLSLRKPSKTPKPLKSPKADKGKGKEKPKDAKKGGSKGASSETEGDQSFRPPVPNSVRNGNAGKPGGQGVPNWGR
ncbi:hypothetical protein EJ08DRAFT_661885 [Tothia fuscella]|uniref:Uncharacterized protein n=1 Tax=Tothia fuscella TaxID=1048955 RepID=A0A9P4NPP1_9PEZI|nr:hypothetical protein EJ08DRAFT_661885 [Tothia fuscella]